LEGSVSADFAVLGPIGMLLAGVALEGLLAGALSARAKGWIAFLSGLAALAGVVAVWPEVLAGQVLDVSFGRWDGPIQLAYHVDGLSLLFALMAAGIGAAVLLYSVGYMEGEKGTTRFYSLMLLFIAGLIHPRFAHLSGRIRKTAPIANQGTSEKFLGMFGWEAGTRTPIRRSRVCSLTIRRPPKAAG
jgi:hypothetical protein